MKTIQVKELPENADPSHVYKIIPKEEKEDYYKERTDRNIGIINNKDQQLLKTKIVAIAGCGGMGGYLAMGLLRLGVGELRIADLESFDISNLNRQWAANKSTIGKSKAFETAHMLRNIATDTTISVYPMGITNEMLPEFVSGCDIIIDEIEFWELSAPIILHQKAREAGITILGANTAGFGAHLFKFTNVSMTIEEALGVNLSEAKEIDRIRNNKMFPTEELEKLIDRLLLIVTPELKNYHPNEYPILKSRLLKEGRASIISTNPIFAAGFLGDQVLLHLLPHLNYGEPIPSMPGYVYIDARKIEGKIVTKKWF